MSAPISMLDYSIIVCTYNPDNDLLKRCLSAIENLNDLKETQYEIILVDNNSAEELITRPYIQNFISEVPSAKIIRVERQGLIHARLAAISIAKGHYLIFFDDDNEPNVNYLTNIKELHSNYPFVAAWGPGKISVELLGNISPILYETALKAFQLRQEEETVYDDAKTWSNSYPFGTGLCIPLELAKDYLTLVQKGKFTLQGRTGDRMTSGEDTQLVLFCISKGYAAGVSPNLILNHLIPQKRLNLAYLKKLTYGTSFCYPTCLTEVFPEEKANIENRLTSRSSLVRKSVKGYIKTVFSSNPLRALNTIYRLSTITGNYHAINKPIPKITTWVLKKLGAF